MTWPRFPITLPRGGGRRVGKEGGVRSEEGGGRREEGREREWCNTK